MIMKLTVYLAGEIHTNWREELEEQAKKLKLPLTFVAPQTNHDRSDNVGEDILGTQPGKVYKDDAASDINNFRTTVLMQKADIVIALFCTQYTPRNTELDLSTAVALNIPTLFIRPDSLIHPLKELCNKANVTVENVKRALEVLKYVYE